MILLIAMKEEHHLGMPGRGLALLAVALLAGAPVRAQTSDAPAPGPRLEARLVHEHWTVHDGLPVNHANSLYQTPDGYLWLATFDGLVRFDGVRFTIFNAGNTEGLPSSRVISIEPGRGGSFWLSTEQGHLVRVAGEHFEPSDVSPGWVNKVYQDGDSLTWIAAEQGLYRYHAGQLEPTFEDALKGVSDVLRDRHGTLWFTQEADLFRKGRRVASVGSPLSDLLCDREGSLWATTTSNGLHRFRPPRIRTYSVAEGLGFRNLYHVYEDRFGALWFAGQGGTVSRLHDGIFQHYTAGTHFDAIKDPAVSSDQTVYEDRAGNLWLGFQVCRAALRRADGVCPRFTWAEGAPRAEAVYALRQTRDGALWFGTSVGLYRLDHGAWTHFTTQDGLPDDFVRYLLETRDGSL